jgi:hypothetical protein
MLPTRPSVRKVLEIVLRTDSDLNAFCGDYFDEVYRRFSGGMDRISKVTLLLDCVPPVEIVEALRSGYTADMQRHESLLEWRPLPGRAASPAAPSVGAEGALSTIPSASESVAGPPFADPALEELREAYEGGNLVIFAGAGISAAAGLPSWKQLVDILLDRAKARGASQAALAEIVEMIDKEQLIEALSALKDCLGGPEFGVTIERHLSDRDRPIPEVARAIASLAPRLRTVLTTNLDHLLERALVWPALARATGDIAQRREKMILKLHGTLLDRSTWVFTRDDYDRAMYADPKLQGAFSALFHSCPLLFVGYGLSDADFDQVLGRVRAFAGDQPPRHFALVAAETVTPHRRSRLERSGIRVITYDNPDGRHGEVVRVLRGLPRA